MAVKFEVPGKDAPGYLKRQRKLAEFMAYDGDAPERWDLMIEYLLEFVTEPKDRDKAREALWEMSEGEYEDMLTQLSAQADVPKNK